MTDHGNMFGAIDFYNAMRKAQGALNLLLEWKPTFTYSDEELDDKTTKQRFHLCLYAKNQTGYKNLMYLSSQAYMHGFYYYPRINKKLLRENSEGIGFVVQLVYKEK